jgi:hypothetical protein
MTSKKIAVVLAALLAVGCAARMQPRGRTPLEGAGGPPFMFVVIGDSRPGLRADPDDEASVSVHYLEQVHWVNRSGPDFSINVGDLILGNNTGRPGLAERQWTAYDRASSLLEDPYFMVAGNHDVWDAPSEAIYRRRYGPLYYSFDHKGSHFVVLCTDIPGERGSIGPEQLAWLRIDLAASSWADHRFVFLHRPLWYRGGRSRGIELSESWMADVHPLLVEHEVDTVFAGHDHFYEFREEDGVRYVITGGGGAPLYRPPALGGFRHFLEVRVAREERPEIVVVERGKTHPQDVARAEVAHAVTRAARSVRVEGTLFAGGEGPVEFTLPVENPLDTEAVFELDWEEGEDVAEVRPASVLLVLPSGAERAVAFAADLTDPELRRPALSWRIEREGETLAEGQSVLPVARRGLYSLGAEGGAPETLLALGSRSQITSGGESWQGPADSSAEARVTRTDAGILVEVAVTDDRVRADGDRPWQCDSVEMYFDLRPTETRGKGRYEKGVFQLIAVPDVGREGRTALHFFPGKDRGVPGRRASSEVTAAGYTVEVFLPAEGIERRHLVPGDEFNFDFGVNDADAEAKRETQLMWSGTGKNHRDPAAFGRLRPFSEAD